MFCLHCASFVLFLSLPPRSKAANIRILRSIYYYLSFGPLQPYWLTKIDLILIFGSLLVACSGDSSWNHYDFVNNTVREMSDNAVLKPSIEEQPEGLRMLAEMLNRGRTRK